MRVPIYPVDLNLGSGFTRIAESLTRDWPGEKTIEISEAQNLLAKCLGYSDYHQVRSTTPAEGSAYPSLATVVAHCMKTLSSELVGGGRTKFFDLGRLQAQVTDWPFLQLSVYREHYGHSDNRVVSQAVNAELIEAFLPTQKARPAHRTSEFSIERLQSMTGHEPVNSTLVYARTSMGACLNKPPLSEKLKAFPNGRCVECGPSTNRTRH
ncbi:hypothetical protein [Pseudomonas antarctica]|uniref:hypothetical protein n=1 Tax=Pseudomonas antarctica TaxID=219572 RepID=UPI003F7507FE